MSDLVHISKSLTCPGIKANPERDTHDAWESIDFLWTYLSDFGYQHCVYGCIGCLERMGKNDKKHLPPEPAGNYRSVFADLHEALGQLPENLFRHLSDISNSDCPACAVLTALQQFSTIARYSENKPIGWEALPCYFEEDIDQRGDYFWNSVRHIDALRNLDLSKLPPRMPPAERRDAKARLAPGKAVIEFIHDFHKRQIQLPPTMSDDELWAVLACSDQIRTLNENNLFVSPRWKSWAKESILNGDNGSKGAFVSRVGLVAFDCHRNIQEARDSAHFGMWMPEVSEYGVILSILTAAYFYSSGVALTEQDSDVWFEKAAQGFIVFERDDFGKRYYGLSALGSALALRHGGSPPPFLQQEAERGAGPAPHLMPSPITVTNTDIIDNDITANPTAQAAALGGDGGKGGDSDSVASVAIKKDVVIEKDGIKQIQTTNVAAPDLSPFALAEQARQDGETKRLQLVLEQLAGNAAKVPAEAPLDGPLRDTNKNKDTSGYASSADLAKKHGIKHVVLKKRLERFRKETLTGWIEVADRGPKDPQFLYQEDAVTHLLAKD